MYVDNHGRDDLSKFDQINESKALITNIPTKNLITKNRQDILYRVDFLNKTIKEKISPKKTLYYQFVSDPVRLLKISADDMIKNFLTAYLEIKNNSIEKPISVAKFNSEFIKTRYIINNQKNWKQYKNESEYQIIDGAHRLAIAIFLKLDEVPVKIYESISFEIPNYTDFLKIREPEYQKKLKRKN